MFYLTLILLAVFGVAYAATDIDSTSSYSPHEPVYLDITSYNPTCTALYLHQLNVTRLTDVRPWSQTTDFTFDYNGYWAGESIIATIWGHELNKTTSALVERSDIAKVTVYNATNSTILE